MILGQPTDSSNRLAAFTRPQGAAFYTPGFPKTAFFSHFQPFPHAGMLPLATFRPRLPHMPDAIKPGVLSPPTTGPLPVGPSPAVPTAPQQLQGAMFGHPPGVSPFSFLDQDPSRLMRTGAWFQVPTTAAGVRAGVTDAGALIHRLTPAGYPNAAVPAGNY